MLIRPLGFNSGMSPIFMVPSRKNPDFVGREETLNRLESLLPPDSESQQRAALYGLGGNGKTTIAIEFCHRRQKAKPDGHIFWVLGDSYQNFKSSYLEVVREANIIIDGIDLEEDRLKQVKKWLDSATSGDWILIVDNFDNLDHLANHDEPDLRLAKYLPVKRGAILYTTRDGTIVGNFVPRAAAMHIRAMSDAEALRLFTNLSPTDEAAVSKDTIELLNQLDHLPLAITQAAAYIRETGVEISTYMKMFKECENNQEELLSKALPVQDEDSRRHCSRAVMTTWKLTVGKIRNQSPDSVRLLEIMSFLSPDDIPKGLLRGVLSDKSDVQFSAAFAPLLAFSLIDRLKSSKFRLHRLVGLCIRREIAEIPQRRDELLETLCGLLYDSFPQDMRGNHNQCSLLEVHAITVLLHTSNSGSHKKFHSSMGLPYCLGSFLVTNNRDAAGALTLFQQALDGCEKALGKDHPDTLATVHSIAITYDNQGDYHKALEWFQRALDGREKALGKDHHYTLATVHNMANTFHQQGDYHKALEWLQRALDGREKALGKDHPDTLHTVHTMANTFLGQGDYHKALEWFQRALDGREKALGKDHPDTLATVHNMANTFHQQGDYQKSLELYQRALDGYEKALGKDHPDTLNTVNNMANTFHQQGEYHKALEWFQRALDGYEKALGKDHPHTLATLATVNNMALAFREQGYYHKVLEWFQWVCRGILRLLRWMYALVAKMMDLRGGRLRGPHRSDRREGGRGGSGEVEVKSEGKRRRRVRGSGEEG
ncbi:hypothetical protein BZA05DRAFT_63506 [Tricharina praecox]|uniref:uncharacterized protein n=1 Tax=Tricharina praecox TaxID=43433 RepID=UPI00221F2490|nr:uncharacterized protein BZA05DRAFT_63506 [Tricharina praecox]KAI5849924.1 hypothetical protein BZA05DRAFT_63506 [Tricharina praecox]